MPNRRGRLTTEELAHIRRVFPPENNYTIRVLLDEIEALRAELREREAKQAAGELCRMSWDELVSKLRKQND